MALCVAVMIISQFLLISPSSLIADDLHVAGGLAQQALWVAGPFAIFVSLSIARLAGSFDCKQVSAAPRRSALTYQLN